MLSGLGRGGPGVLPLGVGTAGLSRVSRHDLSADAWPGVCPQHVHRAPDSAAAEFRPRPGSTHITDTGERGLDTRISIVAWWNEPSMRASTPAGSRVVGSIGYWNLGLRRLHFATGAVRSEPSNSFRVLLDGPSA